MGFVKARVKIRGKSEITFEDILIDSGARFTILPLNVAEKHLIETPFEVELTLGDKRKVKAKVFIGGAEIEGRKGPVRILTFKEAVPVIGVDTLETLGLRINPVTGKIEKTEYYMLYV